MNTCAAEGAVLSYITGFNAAPSVVVSNMRRLRDLVNINGNSTGNETEGVMMNETVYFDVIEYASAETVTPDRNLSYTRFVDGYLEQSDTPVSLSRYDLNRILLNLINDLPRNAPSGLTI